MRVEDWPRPVLSSDDGPGKGDRAVILLSGGLDSATTLAWALDRGAECHALSFDYRQRHRAELDASAMLAKRASSHRVVRIDSQVFAGSALTDLAIPVPAARTTRADSSSNDSEASGTRSRGVRRHDIPVTYVPARNTIFLAYALGLAESIDAGWIVMGANAVDYSGYPDCRPLFLDRFQALAASATRAADGEREVIRVAAPLMHLAKSEIIRLGVGLKVDYGATVSCYAADERGRACGLCESCALRRAGFAEAGVVDPTRYQVVP
ncbi:MAG: 7-cyano-7-deazaguanine synthase QueC [Thioalkalivibrionaceae bacterium]